MRASNARMVYPWCNFCTKSRAGLLLAHCASPCEAVRPMPRHTVQAGECLSTIAHRYGFADWRAIFAHEENSSLRAKRPNPNLLCPGDVVFVPDRRSKKVEIATGRTHRFVLKQQSPMLVLVLRAKGGALARRKCQVDDDGLVQALTTDDNGRIEVPLRPASRTVKLSIEGLPEEILLQLGHLDPVTEVTGVQARLLALGFYQGAVDGQAGLATRRALREFQYASELEPSGDLSPETEHALTKAYGG